MFSTCGRGAGEALRFGWEKGGSHDRPQSHQAVSSWAAKTGILRPHICCRDALIGWNGPGRAAGVADCCFGQDPETQAAIQLQRQPTSHLGHNASMQSPAASCHPVIQTPFLKPQQSAVIAKPRRQLPIHSPDADSDAPECLSASQSPNSDGDWVYGPTRRSPLEVLNIRELLKVVISTKSGILDWGLPQCPILGSESHVVNPSSGWAHDNNCLSW
jgi:hypothetical protein